MQAGTTYDSESSESTDSTSRNRLRGTEQNLNLQMGRRSEGATLMTDEVFTNNRSGAKARELRAYQTESEAEAKARLEAAGWLFTVSYTWDDNQKMFKIGDDTPADNESEAGSDE